MERSIGDKINANNWRQGSVLKNRKLPASIERLSKDEAFFVITTQSCDLVHDQLEDEPFAECIECRSIEKEDGNFTFAKNPRRLHMSISHTDSSEQPVEILARRIHRFPRQEIAGIPASEDHYLSERNCKILVRWLASRYDRPAFPDAFNNRLRQVKTKLRKKAVRISKAVTGLYIEINPEQELEKGEQYYVNLLALVSVDFDGNMVEIESDLEAYAQFMNDTGLETNFKILKENEVSVFDIRRFSRLDWDYISLRDDPPHDLPIT